MEATQFGGNGEPLVISRIDEGFRVYSVANPGKSDFVSGSAEAPVCTCPEFQNGTLGTRCKHLSLDKDCSDSRPVMPLRIGKLAEIPRVGGLHHRYERFRRLIRPGCCSPMLLRVAERRRLRISYRRLLDLEPGSVAFLVQLAAHFILPLQFHSNSRKLLNFTAAMEFLVLTTLV
jgi:hypothetical protein